MWQGCCTSRQWGREPSSQGTMADGAAVPWCLAPYNRPVVNQRSGRGPDRDLRRVIRGWPFRLLIIFLLLDATFIQLHRLYLRDVVGSSFALTNEDAYPEYYENGKELLLTVLALMLAAEHQEGVYRC